jgi:hypothetical protein
MTLMAVFNAILAVGVTVMVVTPLVWAILTQHRDHPRPAATEAATMDAPQSRERQHTARPHYQPVAGRI